MSSTTSRHRSPYYLARRRWNPLRVRGHSGPSAATPAHPEWSSGRLMTGFATKDPIFLLPSSICHSHQAQQTYGLKDKVAMPLPFLSRKSDKKLFQPREIPQVSRPIPQQQRPRFSEPRSVKYIAADEEEEVQVPDTRVLAALGECASQVAMVETYDAPLLSPSGRRSSNASASSSSVLITPTFPYEPQWRRTDKVVPEVSYFVGSYKRDGHIDTGKGWRRRGGPGASTDQQV